MTTVLAIVFTAIALVIVSQPLFVRRSRGSTVELGEAELQERYRNALADLQDAELDHEIGNLTDQEYDELRERYRLRAADALRQIDQDRARREQHRAEIAREIARRSAQAPGDLGVEPARQPAASPRKLSLPMVAGGMAVLAVAGIVLLYLRQSGQIAAQAPVSTLAIAHAHAIVVDDRGELWVGHHDGLLRSTDGRSWRPAGVSGDVMAIVQSPDRTSRLALGHDVELQSRDGGSTWTPLVHDLPGTDVHGAQEGANGLYAYVVGKGLMLSQDGAHWSLVGPDRGLDVGSLAVLPGPPADQVYLAAGGSLIRSPDGGRTWNSAAGAGNGALGGQVRSVAADASTGVVYAATSSGLFRSTNGGTDWLRLPFRESGSAVGVQGQRVAAIDDQQRFYLSNDGGFTWLGDQ